MSIFRIKKNIFSGLHILIFLLAYLFFGNMLAVYATGFPYREVIRFVVTIFGIVLLTHKVFKYGYNCSILFILFLFVIFSIIPTLQSSTQIFPLSFSFLCLTDSLFWIAIFCISYTIGNKKNFQIDKIVNFVWLLPFFAVLFWNVKRYFVLVNNENTALVSSVYYSLCLFPFIFLVKKELLRWGLISLVFFTILVSTKRTGFIVFFLVLFVFSYITYIQHSSIKRKIIFFISGCLCAFVFYFLFEYVTQTLNLNVVERLMNAKEDGGSGRNEVWACTWKMITESSFLDLLFGHGFNMVIYDSPLELSAHNDYMEVIYDYGIIGSIFYMIFYIKLYGYMKLSKRISPKYHHAFFVSFILVLFFSISSHLIIYPTYFLFLCAFWGLVVGYCDRNIKYAYGRK